jgi:excisionase family DNA binding protein
MSEPPEFEYVLERQSGGGFLIYVSELPGLATEGDTREEAIAMLRDALPAYLESTRAHSLPLSQVERAQAHGRESETVVVRETLSTQHAANLLGVSRPHLTMLLDRDRIPYQTTVGGHRRIRRSDIEDYRERQALAHAAMRESMRSAEELADDE